MSEWDSILGRKPSKCRSCRFFAKETESWEMPHVWWYECRKRPANEHLKSFPFTNGCKLYEPKATEAP